VGFVAGHGLETVTFLCGGSGIWSPFRLVLGLLDGFPALWLTDFFKTVQGIGYTWEVVHGLVQVFPV
jgi:hypothetical protein